MRSNHLKRHMKTHKDILSVSDEEVREELQRRKILQIQGKRQKVDEMVEQEDILNNHEQLHPSSCKSDIESLRADLLKGNQVYLDKIEQGRQINTIMEKGVVNEESLNKHHKVALYLYLKQKYVKEHHRT